MVWLRESFQNLKFFVIIINKMTNVLVFSNPKR